MRWAFFLSIVVLGPAAACIGESPTQPSSAPDGGDPLDASGSPDGGGGGGACKKDLPFGPPVALGELNTLGADEDGASLTDSETEVFFMASTERHDGGPYDWEIYSAARASAQVPFGAPSLVAALAKGNHVDAHPSVTADGSLVVYQGGIVFGKQGLWYARRPNAVAGFDPPKEVAGLAVGDSADTAPFLTADGARLYFSSNRNGSYDLFVAPRQGDGFGAPITLQGTDLNTAAAEGSPVLTRDELTLYFTTNRELTTEGDFDLRVWTAKRRSLDAPFDPPSPVAELNAPPESKISTRPTWVSVDGCRLYIASSRAGKFDLYVVEKPR